MFLSDCQFAVYVVTNHSSLLAVDLKIFVQINQGAVVVMIVW
jgi:hypothetical protein